MTEKTAALNPGVRSHSLFRTQPQSKDQVSKDEQILRLVEQMPLLLCHCDEEAESRQSTTTDGEFKSCFRLVVPSDVNPASAALLEPSWFVNIVITIADRNGCVIYHETHSPKNRSLRKNIPNFDDIRWEDYVHPLDADIWSQHLLEAFAQAERWRNARLAAGCEIGVGGSKEPNQRRRANSSGPQQQVVSTTSRVGPDISDSGIKEAQLRRFVTSPLYRARWGGLSDVYYLRTVSLPFLRNQSDDPNKTPTSIIHESANVFSPTSSFENLLLLNYHCVLGKVPDDALSGAVEAGKPNDFSTSMRNPTGLSPPKSAIAPVTTTTTTAVSPIDHLARVFSFDNLLGHCAEVGGDAKATGFRHNHSNQGLQQVDGHSGAYRQVTPPKTQPRPLGLDAHSSSNSSAHLAPVDIDWIDRSQPSLHHYQQQQHQQQQQQHYSGKPQVASPAIGSQTVVTTVQSQNKRTVATQNHRQRFRGPTNAPQLNTASLQHHRISIFLSLLLPEAIREIKEAVSAEPDLVAQRVRAIVTRHLGPEFLSKFFSYLPHSSATISTLPTLSLPLTPSTSSFITTLSSLENHCRTINAPMETGCCGNDSIDATDQDNLTSQTSSSFLLLKKSSPHPSKRPSLVQELAVTTDNGPLPPSNFCSSNLVRNNFFPICSVSCGSKLRIITTAPVSSSQTSGAPTPNSLDSVAGSSPWMTAVRGSQQSALPLSLPSLSSQKCSTAAPSSSSSSSASCQETHSTAGVLESLLMGGYVSLDSRLRHVSDSSMATIFNTADNTTQRKDTSSVTTSNGDASECRQVLTDSKTSSACCRDSMITYSFGSEMEEWPAVTSTGGTSNTRRGIACSSSQALMSPNSFAPCSSLAHLLRHGCPPAPGSSINVVVTTTATVSATGTTTTEPLSSSAFSRASAVGVIQQNSTSTASVPTNAPLRPLDCPLSVIIDSQPSLEMKNAAHQPQKRVDEERHYQSALPTRTRDVSSAKLPHLAPRPRLELANKDNHSFKRDRGRSKVSKPNIRDTSEDEDAALANSSLCRLLQGPDPCWETVPEEVDVAEEEEAHGVPPPPPPSFFELPSDVLVLGTDGSGGDEVGQASYDSCPMAVQQSLSLSASPQICVPSIPLQQSVAPTILSSVTVEESIGDIFDGSTGDNIFRGPNPSSLPINTMDRADSPPMTAEKNRRAATAAAAQIAEEAEQQSRQRPSPRHLLERERLLFQQNLGQVTSFGSGSYGALEGTSRRRDCQRQHQQQSNCGYRSCGNMPLISSAAAPESSHQMQAFEPEGFDEPNMVLPLASATTAAPLLQPPPSLANRQIPLEDFSRRMKEIAPNVRVSMTDYPIRPVLYLTESRQPHHENQQPQPQQQQQAPQFLPTYKYSSGHLAPSNYEYQDHRPSTSSQDPLTVTPPHYGNPIQEPPPPPPYTSHLLSIQPKLPNYHQSHHNLQHHPNSHRPHQYQQQQLQQHQPTYYHPQPQLQLQPHPNRQHMHYHQQGPSLSQPSQSNHVSVPYSLSHNTAYYDPHFSLQQQHHLLMQQKTQPSHTRPPNYVSPLSLALQQDQPLSQSQRNPNRRDRVTNRCQGSNLEAIATCSEPRPPPLNIIVPPRCVGPPSTMVIGQKRPLPPESHQGHNEMYFYGQPALPSPPFNQAYHQMATEMDMPFLDDSNYQYYQQQAPFPSSSNQRFAECQSSMLFEPQQYAPVCGDASIDNANTITAIYNNGSNTNKVNDDIQLTADIVNDVLEFRTSGLPSISLLYPPSQQYSRAWRSRDDLLTQ